MNDPRFRPPAEAHSLILQVDRGCPHNCCTFCGMYRDVAYRRLPLPEVVALIDDAAKVGMLSIRIGLGWAKSHSFMTGQCPVMKYHRQLMQAILYDKIAIAKAVNVQTISLDQAPGGYADFDKGAATKFVIDPNDVIPR